MEEKVCKICGQVYEEDSLETEEENINSYLEEIGDVCVACKKENNLQIKRRKLRKKFNK